MAKIIKEGLNLQEALNNLALVASIDVEHPPRIGILRNHCFVTDEEELPLGAIQWLSSEGSETVLEILQATYRAVFHHLVSLYENGDIDWDNQKTKESIVSMMELVGESANKMDRYLSFWMDKSPSEKVSQTADFKALGQFYTHRLLPKLQESFPGSGSQDRESLQKVYDQNQVLQDFETIQRDQEYELFYIHNEQGKSYLNEGMLRKIRLSVDYESTEHILEEDPLLKIRSIEDRNLQASAHQILQECDYAIQDLFKMSKKTIESPIAQILHMAIMALFLAKNSQNLVQNTAGKSCLDYFNDFHHFLRSAIQTSEYQKWIAYPPDRTERIPTALLHLIHLLCRAFFHRVGGTKQEAIGLIYRMMRKGTEVDRSKLIKVEGLWNRVLLEDDHLRSFLSQFPNGPLFKILDHIREERKDEESTPFDPIAQQNRPCKLYSIQTEISSIEFLKLPSPTRQFLINKVEIVEEFRGFLRSLNQDSKKKKHLIINLQDRFSWQESIRSRGLENLHKTAEFHTQLIVCTIPKNNDFYYQNHEYFQIQSAEAFLVEFRKQLESAEKCGYYFPNDITHKEVILFATKTFPLIHTHFFQKKEILSRRDREDFIEIFYQLLIAYMIKEVNPFFVSFTCKDAIDTGAAQSALFYAFMKLFRGDFSKKEDFDSFFWLLYTPALFVRERAINAERANRVFSALEKVHSALDRNHEKIMSAFSFIPLLKEGKL